MRSLDLFSGIGGFALGLESVGFKTSAFCERDAYCQKVLAKHWPSVPIHPDITELDGYEYRGSIELVCGGWPCQPYSTAGQQKGATDDRALWPEMHRVIREVAPRWVIGENVSGIFQMELDQVFFDLESANYSVATFNIPACAVDAHHKRERVWVLAHTNSQRGRSRDTKRQNAKHARQRSAPTRDNARTMATWEPEPCVGRVAYGIPRRAHRLKALGNAVVPQVVAEIGRMVMAYDKEYLSC